jgi:TetR/AcrR family transcriptional regulator, transcriptional repressor for nem operon
MVGPTATTPADGGRSGSEQAQRILDVAERVVQTRGFNAFSYADVAEELGVTKASVHYHFRSKAELGEALMVRYAERFGAALAAIDAQGRGPAERLAAYIELYVEVLRGRRMCLCGMLAAEYQTLPQPMRHAVVGFLGLNEAWLERTLEQGRRTGVLTVAGSPQAAARMIVSALQGAMLLARPEGEVDGFVATARGLISSITGTRWEPAPAASAGG